MGRLPQTREDLTVTSVERRKTTSPIAALRRGAGAVRWYVAAVMGDSDYRRYVVHHNERHPDVAPLSESDYWRMRYRNQDANPQGRCC